MQVVSRSWLVVSAASGLWSAVQFCFGLCALLLVFSSSVEGQQSEKVFHIGFLSGGLPGPLHWTARLRAELQRIGYVEGKNITIESRFTENKIDRLPTLAAELVRLKPDVIVTGGQNDARAAKNATKTIPLVGTSMGDPVANGLIESLARPGGNLTGVTSIVDELAGKRLELLKEIVPNLSVVALLWNTQYPDSARASKLYQAPARELNLQLHSMGVSGPDGFEPAFKEATKARSGALAMTAGAFLSAAANQKRIADLAAKHRLPAISDRDTFVANGGLMSYGADDSEQIKRVAVFVDKILRGAKPTDIPVEQPKKFELVINVNAAKQIGLTIPPNVLARADRVIR
jgi:putative tryptophan/tyrosine transport system substrate-binding protein